MKDEIQKSFDDRTKKEKEELMKDERFINALPLQKTEFLLALRLRSLLRL